jgi:hypothetical protein
MVPGVQDHLAVRVAGRLDERERVGERGHGRPRQKLQGERLAPIPGPVAGGREVGGEIGTGPAVVVREHAGRTQLGGQIQRLLQPEHAVVVRAGPAQPARRALDLGHREPVPVHQGGHLTVGQVLPPVSDVAEPFGHRDGREPGVGGRVDEIGEREPHHRAGAQRQRLVGERHRPSLDIIDVDVNIC